MKKGLKVGLGWTALILLVIGGFNWLFVGLFDFNFVTALFKSMPVIANIVYVLVGASALYLVINRPKFT